MAACEGFGAAIYLRAVLAECITGRRADLLSDPNLREIIPITGVTDCKLVYDTIQSEGVKLPTEKRLGLEIAALRDMVQSEADPLKSHTCLGGLPLRWVPTQAQLADVLTKSMDGATLRAAVETGRFNLTESDAGQAKCFVAHSLRDLCRALIESHSTDILE